MEERVARVYRFKKVLKYSILSLVLAIVGILIFEYFRIKPNNVYFTNITSSSVTVSWDTKIKTDATAIYVEPENKLPFLILPIFKEKFFDTRDMTKAELEAAQQSSQNQEGLEVTMNDIVTNVSVTDRGRYYTHHVEIKGLDPEKEYSFMVGDSIVFRKAKDVNDETIAKTYAIPESILTPYPAYGAVRDAEDGQNTPIEELPIVDDGIVYFSYYEKTSEERSVVFSSPLNEAGNWYIDVSNAINNEGESFTTAYSDSEGTLFVELNINLGPKGIWKSINNPALISPMETTIININSQNSNEGIDEYEIGDLFKISTKLESTEPTQATTLGVFKSLAYSNCTSGTTCQDCTVPSCPSTYPLTICPSGTTCNSIKVSCTKSCSASGMPCGESTKTCFKVESSPSCTCTCSTGSKTCSSANGCTKISASCSPTNCANVTCYVPNSQPVSCGDYKCDGGHVCPSGFSETKPAGNSIEEKKSCVGENDCGKTTSINYTCYKATSTPQTETTKYLDWVGYCGPCRWLYSDGTYGAKSQDLCETQAKDKLIQKNCAGYSQVENPAQENDKCEGYHGKVVIGIIELHNNICRICAYKTTQGGSQYAQWDDAIGYTNVNGTCRNSGSSNPICNINGIKGSEEQCDPSASITGCTGDKICNNSCECVLDSELETDPDPVVGQLGEEPEPSEEKYCWEKGSRVLSKCDSSGKCKKCINGRWEDMTVIGDILSRCSEFVANSKNSCIRGYCYNEDSEQTYDCKNGKWELYSHSNEYVVAVSRTILPQGEKCSTYCVCHYGFNLIEKDEYCPFKPTDKNIGKRCHITNEKKVWDKNDNGHFICVSKDDSANNFENLSNKSLYSNLNITINHSIKAEEKNINEIFLIDSTTEMISGLEAGVYSFENNDETYFFDVSDEALAANKGGVLIYIDTNENGQYDEDTDTKVSSLGAQIEITTIQKNYKFTLEEGFNFVSFPFVVAYDEYRTAAELLKQLNEVYGDVIYSISKYDGAWKVVGQNVDVYDNNNFQLVPGQGYVIKAKEDIEITIPGKPVKYENAEDSAPVTLLTGWNLIGLYGSNIKSYTAKSMIQDINAFETVDFTADNVSKWESDIQRYEGYQLTNENGIDLEYGFDYPLNILQSYFVRVNQGTGNWQPKLAE